MTIFDYITDILVTKRGDLPLDQYTPYLVNRWLSFINPTVCEMINLNINSKVLLENKDLHYKTMLTLFPKIKYCPKINYIKKIKEDEEQKEDMKISVLAQNLEISKREAKFILEFKDNNS